MDDHAESAPLAWDWFTDEVWHAELAELRGAVAALREKVAKLQRATDQAHARERELRAALHQIAAAGVWQRRRLRADFRSRGLL